MSDEVLTPNGVVARLAELSRHLGTTVDALDTAERTAVNSREDYTLALSKAFLRAEGAMDLRKHSSIVDTHAERLAAELAEALVRGLRRQVDTIKVRIDIGRTMGTTLRAELSAHGGQS